MNKIKILLVLIFKLIINNKEEVVNNKSSHMTQRVTKIYHLGYFENINRMIHSDLLKIKILFNIKHNVVDVFLMNVFSMINEQLE
jgi:hypothetical protein